MPELHNEKTVAATTTTTTTTTGIETSDKQSRKEMSALGAGAGRAGADGPELVAGSDDARRNGGGRGCVLCGYQHGCLSTVMSRDHW